MRSGRAGEYTALACPNRIPAPGRKPDRWRRRSTRYGCSRQHDRDRLLAAGGASVTGLAEQSEGSQSLATT